MRMTSPKSLAAAALIFSLILLIAAESANALHAGKHRKRKPKPAGIFQLYDKLINGIGNGHPLLPIRPLPSLLPPTKPVVDIPEKNETTSGDLKEEFLAAHNDARAAVGHSPLQWNNTLADISKKWALNRINDCKMIHSPKAHDHHGHGENLFWGQLDHWSPKKVVKSWVDEKVHYDPKTNTCIQPTDPKHGKHQCGHYTQIIWQDTVQVGCARVKCLNKRGERLSRPDDVNGRGTDQHVHNNNLQLNSREAPPVIMPVIAPAGSEMRPIVLALSITGDINAITIDLFTCSTIARRRQSSYQKQKRRHQKKQSPTMISSPKSLAAAALIFSLLFIAAESAKPQKPKDDKYIYASGNVNPTPTSPLPSTPPKKPTVDLAGKELMVDNFKEEYLAAHNRVRASVGHSPLQWNNSLAGIAKQWASKRKNDCKMIHSTAGKEPHDSNAYGENLFWGKRSHWTPTKVVKHWADEKAYYNRNTNTCSPPKPKSSDERKRVCGHYTQIVWKDTASVGCAHIKCVDDQGFLFVCAYYPPGNYNSEDPFHNYV
ncbi:Allergen V5/Tpx-1-related protein [Corchorus olitorius]|uniref:Allergen V5/Tpx-1-related protein n=1 Tax=Corchorus olitorius TaxID=93759 RepID=A0A1R3K981_9ROSI|nr:Allergen V5/Tpx-1-related protein [Corchorus olitorius]